MTLSWSFAANPGSSARMVTHHQTPHKSLKLIYCSTLVSHLIKWPLNEISLVVNINIAERPVCLVDNREITLNLDSLVTGANNLALLIFLCPSTSFRCSQIEPAAPAITPEWGKRAITHGEKHQFKLLIKQMIAKFDLFFYTQIICSRALHGQWWRTAFITAARLLTQDQSTQNPMPLTVPKEQSSIACQFPITIHLSRHFIRKYLSFIPWAPPCRHLSGSWTGIT